MGTSKRNKQQEIPFGNDNQERLRERQQQIPFGNDTKKGNGNGEKNLVGWQESVGVALVVADEEGQVVILGVGGPVFEGGDDPVG
jgi:hypothetical protein